MSEIPVIIDTNVWIDIRNILGRLEKKSEKTYKEIWDNFNDLVKENFTKEERGTFRGTINIMERIIEMGKTGQYCIYIPSFLYNEVVRTVSSKITFESTGNDNFDNGQERVFDSLPIKKEIRRTKLESGKHYPPKLSMNTGKTIAEIMESFLKQNKKLTEDLIKYLSNMKQKEYNKKRGEVKSKIDNLKKRIVDVVYKNGKWNKLMMESSKSLEFDYTTRSKELNSLYDPIKNEYQDVHDISFQPDPYEAVTKRLIMKNEEFDFFDLQIYLYAKKLKAPIITKNTQAFQEINDPHFLGYFDDVKIMHPSINFDSLEDLKNSGDLNEIIDRSIEKDFEADLEICKNLDDRLENKVIENAGLALIDEAKLKFKRNYSPTEERLKIDRPLGAFMKLLKIENGQLKVSKKSILNDFNQIDNLKTIDELYFNNQLTSEHFVDNVSIEATRNKILKSDTLADYLKNNGGIKATLEKYKDKSGSYFDEFLKIYKGGTKRAEIINLMQASEIETSFSGSEIKDALVAKPLHEKMPLGKCPAREGSRKREARKCLLEWEDIEEFNREKTREKDHFKVKIDSEKFLDYVKTVKDPDVRRQLINFADQVLNSAEDHLSKISGSKVSEVIHLINKQKVLDHFSKAHSFASALNYGIFAKNLLGDILSGDIEGAALNIGFMAGSYGFSKLAEASFTKGFKVGAEGKLMLGRAMKYASPFIGRFMSAAIVYDLYQQINALKAGNKDALVGVIGDSIFLIIDAVDIGVSLLEIAGLIEGVSAFTGPIGLAIGAVVIIGTEIYFAVRKVQNIDRIIHLTAGERWKIGAGTFFSLGFAKFDLERLAKVKDANNKLAQQALEAIKSNQNIQRIVISSAVLRGEDRIELEKDNTFISSSSVSNLKWHRVRPDDPEGGRIFCAPEGAWESPPSSAVGKCINSIGLADIAIKKPNYTLFNFGDGNDEVQGFKDSPNIFRIGKGKKNMRGGDGNDVFILEGGIKFVDFPDGEFIGGGGSNLLDLRGISNEGTDVLHIDFQERPFKVILKQQMNSTSHSHLKPNLKLHDFDSIIGREHGVEYVSTSCSTKYVDSRGGKKGFKDHVYIKHTNNECNHDKVIHLWPNTYLENEAVTGKFSYFLNDIHSFVRCNLKRNPLYKTLVKKNNQIQHTFFINGTLSDMQLLQLHHVKNEYYDVIIRMHFKDKSGNYGRFIIETTLGYGKDNGGMDNLRIHMKDDVELRYHHNGIYALHKSNMNVLDIIKKYQPIAINFGISFFIHANKEGSSVSIGSDQKDDVLHNDPWNKSYLVGNSGNNVYTIISGRDILGPDPPQIPETDIYSIESRYHTNTLDLHDLSQQIKNDLGKELKMKHIFDSEKLVLYLYTQESQIDGTYSYNNVTSITFRNIPISAKWNSWCKRLHVLLNKAPVVLKCDSYYHRKFGRIIDYKKDIKNYNPSNYYTPLPLVFSDYEIIVISEDDVEPHTEVIVKQKLGQYRFFRLENDLIFSNGLDFKSPAYQPTTLVLKMFYENPAVFYTLRFTFNDKVVLFVREKENIQKAIALEDGYEEYENISNSIISDGPRRSRRDLGTFRETSNSKRFAEFDQSHSPTSFFGSPFGYLTDICYKSLNLAHDYYKSLVGSTPNPAFYQLQNPKDNFPNEHRIANERILGSNTKMPLPSENQITNRDANSTLLLLDTLVRRLNNSKYKLPSEDHLLPPQEQVQKKMVELTKNLGLDPDDIVGSIEKKRQRILNRLSEN